MVHCEVWLLYHTQTAYNLKQNVSLILQKELTWKLPMYFYRNSISMASKYEPDSFERDIDHVFDHDIAVMIRSGYSQGKWPKDRFEWPKETILIVQSPEGTPKMYYNKPNELHAELLFQADLKADLEADLESDLDSANKSPESANKSPEYTCTLYINYSRVVTVLTRSYNS